MINAKELLEITLKNIPKEVEEEIKKIEENLLQSAKEGKRRYVKPMCREYMETIAKILVDEGYKVNRCSGTGGTSLEIYW